MMYDDWCCVIDVEMIGFFVVVKVVLLYFCVLGGGLFVMFGLVGYLCWFDCDGLLVVLKVVNEVLIKGLVCEEGCYDICVNLILVGVIEVGMFLVLFE